MLCGLALVGSPGCSTSSSAPKSEGGGSNTVTVEVGDSPGDPKAQWWLDAKAREAKAREAKAREAKGGDAKGSDSKGGDAKGGDSKGGL
jgi:hypothetical protein